MVVVSPACCSLMPSDPVVRFEVVLVVAWYLQLLVVVALRLSLKQARQLPIFEANPGS